jgi:hypothetical protein
MKDCEEKAVAGVRHVVSICYSRGKYDGREALQILNVISKKSKECLAKNCARS